MLTGYQCEIVAYLTDGDVICRDCAVKRYNTVAIERVDLGLCDVLRPLSRYEVDTWSGECACDVIVEREVELGRELTFEESDEIYATPWIHCGDCTSAIE